MRRTLAIAILLSYFWGVSHVSAQNKPTPNLVGGQHQAYAWVFLSGRPDASSFPPPQYSNAS